MQLLPSIQVSNIFWSGGSRRGVQAVSSWATSTRPVAPAGLCSVLHLKATRGHNLLLQTLARVLRMKTWLKSKPITLLIPVKNHGMALILYSFLIESATSNTLATVLLVWKCDINCFHADAQGTLFLRWRIHAAPTQWRFIFEPIKVMCGLFPV